MKFSWALVLSFAFAIVGVGCGSPDPITAKNDDAPAVAATPGEEAAAPAADAPLAASAEEKDVPAVAGGPEVKVSDGAASKAAVDAPKAPASAPGANADLAGKWAGLIELPAKSDDPNAQMARSMAQMLKGQLRLEIEPDLKFTMQMMVAVEGKVQRKGRELTFAPSQVMGMSPAEAQKLGPPGTTSIDKMTATLSADGKKITFNDKSAPAAGTMVFTRAAPDAPRKSTVAAAEKRWVGDWKGTMSGAPTGISPEQLKQLEQARRALNSNLALALREDNTFVLSMMVQVEGRWKVAEGKIRLDIQGRTGSQPGSTGGNEPIVLTPGSDGSLTAAQAGQTLRFARK